MIDLLVFLALITIFDGRGFLLFLFYLLLKRFQPEIKKMVRKYNKGKSVVDVEEVKKRNKDGPSPKIPEFFSDAFSSSLKLPSMKLLNFKRVIQIIAVLFVILMIWDGFTSIPPGHVGVIYDRGRGVLTETLPEGLHLKIPIWQVIEKMDTRLQAYTMSADPGEGQRYGNDSIESLTKDGQKVHADITIQFRVKGNDAAWIYQNVGLDYDEKVIRPGIRNVARDIITGYDSTKLFTQETRIEAQDRMTEALKILYATNRVSLEDVLLRNIRFSEIYLQAIEDKQIAQQRIQKAEYERQEAEKLKEKKIIEAQAEAEAIRLKGETLRANPQVIQFEFVQKMADDINWGILPNDILPLVDLKRFNQ